MLGKLLREVARHDSKGEKLSKCNCLLLNTDYLTFYHGVCCSDLCGEWSGSWVFLKNSLLMANTGNFWTWKILSQQPPCWKGLFRFLLIFYSNESPENEKNKLCREDIKDSSVSRVRDVPPDHSCTIQWGDSFRTALVYLGSLSHVC